MAEADPVPQIPAAEVPPGAYLLDVREYEEWDAGHAPGAVHIPLGELGARYTELARDRPLYVICRSGIRSDHPPHALAGAAWHATHLVDAMMGWHASGQRMTNRSGEAYDE